MIKRFLKWLFKDRSVDMTGPYIPPQEEKPYHSGESPQGPITY